MSLFHSNFFISDESFRELSKGKYDTSRIDTDELKLMISENSKKIDQDIEELKALLK